MLTIIYFNTPPSVQKDDSNSSTKEPANTEIKNINGTNVLFQYGEPVPSFDTWTQNQEGRQYVSLDGSWKFAEDPQNAGVKEMWFNNNFNDSHWKGESVPGSWDLYDTPNFGSYDGSQFGKGSAFYDGYAWFRKNIHIDSTWKNHFVKLNFLSVSYEAWVYVNGRLAGHHEGGDSPFALDIGQYLKPGKDNVIAVRVYRRPSYSSYTSTNATLVTNKTEVPYKPVDYWPYAGITHSAYLEATSQVTVSKLLTQTGDRTLTVDVVLYNHENQAEKRLLVVNQIRKPEGNHNQRK